MKRFQLRRSYALALLALLVPILVACGGGQPAAQPTAAPAAPAATNPPAEQPTAAPAEQPTAAPAEQPTAAPAEQPTTAQDTGTGKAGGILRMGEPTWPDTLAPQKSSFSGEITVEVLNYEGLTRFDKDLKTIPAAAEKWEYNQDATQITFHLRDGLKYSDGSPLTADAFVKAVWRTIDPRNPGDYQSSLAMIKGADAVMATEIPTDEAKLTDLFNAVGAKATDEKTIVFDLTQPTPYFHTLAALWMFYPAKQELIDQGGETWYEDAANQIGNGPFQITKIDKSTNVIEFKANENYWAGRPKLDGVVYKYITDLAVALQAYKNDEIDVFAPDPNDVPTIKADAALGPQYKEYPGACTYSITFNLTKKPFDNQKVREAFAYALDREAYLHDALKDTQIKTLTWIPPGYPGYDKSETRFDLDPAKAKQLLAEAGYPDGKGLPEIKWAYGSSNPANQARIEYLINMYQKNLGITITPDPVENTTLTSLTKDVATYPQMYTGGWCADYPDQQDWLSVYWHSSTNFAKNTGYKNAEADKLMEQADVELDPAKRAQLYDQAQKMIIGDVAQIIRSNLKNTFLVKPYVKGMDFTPQDSNQPGVITGLTNVTLDK